MTNRYRYRVLAAVQALAVRGQPLTVRAVAARMGVTSFGTVNAALADLRTQGYVDFQDGCKGTLRYTEPQAYEGEWHKPVAWGGS